MPLLVTLSKVTKRFHPRRPPAVDELSLTVERGEILALLGPSGSGKTTTLRLIAGFETPDEGRITLGERIVAEAGDGGVAAVPPEQRHVGIVFQDYALFPHLTVEQNVGFGLSALAGAARRQRVHETLDLVGLADLGRWYPHQLSGGEQQRVALARALAPAPALMLLDEPFSNLDADLRAQMRDDVETVLRSTGTTAIFVTHDQEEAFTIADRVGVLNRGRLEQLGTPETIYHQPATPFVAEFVGAADFLPGVVTAEGIVTEIGTFANVEARAPGERVRVMIRPDDVTFVAKDDGEVIILRRYFRGSETLYCLGLASGSRVHSSQPSSAASAKGTRVTLEARVVHVVAFPTG
ncbi:MAG TPA: ABC transporter ATP-binding protein [Methylomirabilota bacterium]|nr:ABC transporter ATP-binding protein [Methylomirabilota bacterium]